MSKTKAKKEKAFDCLAFKDRVQAQVVAGIKGLTPQEQVEYFNRRAESGPLRRLWRKGVSQSAQSPAEKDGG
jgi:hypothetical protein